METLLTSEEWLELLFGDRLKLLHYEGWDVKNVYFSFYKEKINATEFIFRLNRSTFRGGREWLDKLTGVSSNERS